MTTAIQDLPNDIEALKQIIAHQRQALTDQQEAIERMKQEHAAAIAALFRRYYGPRSERFDPSQLLLFGQQIEQAELNRPSIEEESGEPLATRRIHRRDKHGRGPLPEHLERVDIEHDLESKACPACGQERCRIGQEISEQLEYFPAMRAASSTMPSTPTPSARRRCWR